MAFQSEFADNEKLNKAAVNDADHVGEQFSPKGPWVVLIKKALNAWAAKQRPLPKAGGWQTESPKACAGSCASRRS